MGKTFKVSQVIGAMETIAPPALAAAWDNVGLLIGDASTRARKLMLCIDLTMPVLDEAIAAHAQIVMAYHPIIFKPVSRLTAGATPVAYRAAAAGIAVYSMHTALDACKGGTNDVLAHALGLVNPQPLEDPPPADQCEIVVFVPQADLPAVTQAAFDAGAGRIGNYEDCSFQTRGLGTFRGLQGAHPTLGQVGKRETAPELRLEVVAPLARATQVAAAIRAVHSYEEPVVGMYPFRQLPSGVGMGRVGDLAHPTTVKTLLAGIKAAIGVAKLLVVRPQRGIGGGASGGMGVQPMGSRVAVAAATARPAGDTLVTRAACSAGSCGDSFRAAAARGATFYLTGEMRHHDALAAAAAGLTVACVGHSNSERPALAGLARNLGQMLPGLEIVTSRHDRDPFAVC
jgi:dinuclear metal center YbgI/SA1388 family protein